MKNVNNENYNGYENYETWKVNLELISDYVENVKGDLVYMSIIEIADNFSEYFEEFNNYDFNSNKVNWNELALLYFDEIDEIREEFERLEEEETDEEGY